MKTTQTVSKTQWLGPDPVFTVWMLILALLFMLGAVR